MDEGLTTLKWLQADDLPSFLVWLETKVDVDAEVFL